MFGPVEYSNKTADAEVTSGPRMFVGVVLTAAADAATVIVYDNTAGSGDIVAKLAAAIGTTEKVIIPNGVSVKKGLYVVMTGTAENVTVYYA